MSRSKREKSQDFTCRAEMLLSTGYEHLAEINTWGDRYWGVDTEGNGLNRLGELLMEVREELAWAR